MEQLEVRGVGSLCAGSGRAGARAAALLDFPPYLNLTTSPTIGLPRVPPAFAFLRDGP